MSAENNSGEKQILSLAEQIAKRGALSASVMDSLARQATENAKPVDYNDPMFKAFLKLSNPQKYQIFKAASQGATLASEMLQFIQLSGITADDMHLLETRQGRVCVTDFYIEGRDPDDEPVQWVDSLARYAAFKAEQHERSAKRAAFWERLLSSPVCQAHPEAYAKTKEAFAEAQQRENDAAEGFDTHFRLFETTRDDMRRKSEAQRAETETA